MKTGQNVYYPDPLPPVTHSPTGKRTPALTGDETWLRGEVTSVDHYPAAPPHDHEGDDVATIAPSDGAPPTQVPLPFLRARKPGKGAA